jgi:hypothetical protein
MGILDSISEIFGWIITAFFTLSAVVLFVVFPAVWLIALLFGFDPFR